MEDNGLKAQAKNGPPRWLTILFLSGEVLPIAWVSGVLMKAQQFTRIFEEMKIGEGLPFTTIAFIQYWYLWIISLFLLLAAGILIEIFVKGRRRWLTLVLSFFTMLLCLFIVSGFVRAGFQLLEQLAVGDR